MHGSFKVWFGIAITVCTILILGRLIPQLRSISPLQQVSLILEISVPIQPRRTPQRIYFLSMVLFGFVISQSYLVHLTKIFSASSRHHIKTPEELEKSGIPIYGILGAKMMLESFGYTRLVQRFKVSRLQKLCRIEMFNISMNDQVIHKRFSKLLDDRDFWRGFDDVAEGRVRAAIAIEVRL